VVHHAVRAGESLRQRLARGPLPINEVVGVLREIAKALAYAHERGVVHRDIKPDNVLLTGGTAVVTDFGIAKALSASRTGETGNETRNSLTQVGVSIGTPMYMAPEQAAADPNTDARADLYSFGCLAYELLSGRPPFVGLPPQKLLAAHMSERPQNIAELRRDTPPLLAELVMHCLEKDPEQRPSSANDVVKLLDVATTTSGSSEAASAVLLGGRVRLPVALGVWTIVFGAAYILAKAAIIGIGLPSWVLPGALVVAGLGLPVILFTAYVQRTAHRALIATPTLTPGGNTASYGTMATIAIKASPHVSWKRTVRGGVFAFSAFVLLVGAFMMMRAFGIGPAGSLLAAGRIAARAPILISDFSVKNGDSTLAGVVSEALRASLSQSSAITLVSPATIAAALGRMQKPVTSRLDLALARSVAQREGIKAIVDGEVTQIGSGFIVTVRLITADSGVTLASVQKAVDGPKELIAATDAVGRELRGKLGESLKSVQNAPALERVTTPSIEALRLYSEGAHAYDFGNDNVAAIARLSEAVALDSGFAMAWRKLGSVYNSAGYPPAASDSALEKAFKFRDRLSAHERYTTEGSYYFLGPGLDRTRAAAAYQNVLDDGDSAIAANNLALIRISQRRFAPAESLLLASSRAGGKLVPYINLLVATADQRALDREAAMYKQARTEFTAPSAAGALASIHAMASLSAGRFAEGERLTDSLARNGVGVGRTEAIYNQVYLAALHGNPSQIAARTRAAKQADPVPGNPGLIDSAIISLTDVTAFDQQKRGVDRMEKSLAAAPLSDIDPSNRNYSLVATVFARGGRPDRAKAILAQHAQEIRDPARLRHDEPMIHRALGEIAIAENDPRTAVREFYKGDSLPDGPYDECIACTEVALARAFDKLNERDSAIVHFERFFNDGYYARLRDVDYATRAPATRRLGELYEAKGDRDKAITYYQQFVDLWKNADPELQPQVAEIKKRLARLSDSEKR
jgi:tetratricopeptide (TPR) repeat protein